MRKAPLSQPTVLSDPTDVAWLAGILEGEGTFSVACSTVAVRVAMTDEDVIQRCGRLLGVSVCSYLPSREGAKRAYVVCARGRRAVEVILKVAPLLGSRRREQCRACLELFNTKNAGPRRQQSDVTDTDLLRAWAAKPLDMSFREFAQQLGLSSRVKLKARIERLLSPRVPIELPNICAISALPPAGKAAYFAGLLEGEAHFAASPVVRVALKMTDEDVVRSFAAEWGSAVWLEPARQLGWKPCATTAIYGRRAEQLLGEIAPWLGHRRLVRAQECLETLKRTRELKEASAARVGAKYQLATLGQVWQSRPRTLTLSKLARELRVHPEGLKRQLVQLGIYDAPPAQPMVHTVTCGYCDAEVTSKWSKPRMYCSRLCSIRGNHKHRPSTPAANKP